MVPTGATDARTAKVIQLYATPNPVRANTVDVSPGTGRNLAERRHPSQLTGHPNTDRFGMPPASVTRSPMRSRSPTDSAPSTATTSGRARCSASEASAGLSPTPSRPPRASSVNG